MWWEIGLVKGSGGSVHHDIIESIPLQISFGYHGGCDQGADGSAESICSV